MFGQIPDCLSDVWIDVAPKNEKQANFKINAIPARHPFVDKYEQIGSVKWDHCYRVLDDQARKSHLLEGW